MVSDLVLTRWGSENIFDRPWVFFKKNVKLMPQTNFMNFHLMVMLSSTMGLYGRPVIEVAYGEMIFSLHRGCMRDDSSRRVVGMSAWCIAHVWHTRVNTSVGSVYIIFWFYDIKIYIHIMFQKLIHIIKGHWWSLTLSWPDKVQRMFLTAHEL